MAHKMLDGVTAKTASRPLKIGEANTHHTVMASFVDYGVTAVSALILKLQGSIRDGHKLTGIVSNPGLVVGSTAENIANVAFDYMIDGVTYSKAAVPAGTALVAGYAITTANYGVILVYINASGTITYQYPVVTQAYASADLAMIAGDALQSTIENTRSDLCYLGRVLCYNNTGSEWNSLTDDLTTGGADITNAVFMDAVSDWVDLTTYTFSVTDIAAQRAMFSLVDVPVKWVRLYLSTLTGSGKVTGFYTGGKR